MTTSDGSTLGIYGAYDAAGEDLIGDSDGLGWGVNQRVMCLIGGLSWSKMTNIQIDTERYGEKKVAGSVDISLDLMFAPKPILEEIHYEDQTFDVAGKEEGMLAPQHWGFQVTMQTMTACRKINWGYSTSFGYRPGVQGGNLFLQAGLRFPVIGIRVAALPGGKDA